MYRPLPNYLTIEKSTIEGIGLFATKDINCGKILGKTHILKNDEIIRTPLGGFYNHSDDPNCEKFQKDNCYYLKSIKDIKNGTEITVKYTLYKIF